MNILELLGPIGAILMVYKLGRGRRKLRDRPAPPRAVTAVGDLRPGAYVRIVGEIIPGAEVLSAPLSERECVHYEASVFGYGSAFARRELVAHERKSVEFLVAQGRARVAVRVAEAAIFGTRGDFRPTLRRVAPFLARLAMPTPISPDAAELGLPPRMMVSASGRVIQEIDDAQAGAGGYREPPMRLVLIATEIALTSPVELAG